MTASKIAEIVGTELSKKLCPHLRFFYGQWETRTARVLEDDGTISECWATCSEELAELAFIGAAVRELARRQLIVRVHDCSMRGGQCRVVCWHAITEDTVGTFSGETALAALVAALNESEAP